MLEKNKELVKGKKKNFIFNFIDKQNYTKTKLCIAMFMALAIAVLFEYKFYAKIDPFKSKNRIIIIAVAVYFVLIHFIIKLSTMYEFIYNNRYKIACAFLLFVMVGGYSGSSITSLALYLLICSF